MATSITLQGSMNYIQSYGGFRPLNIGLNNEPAVTAANIVLQSMIGAPFCWPWNRSSISFMTSIGTQDYSVSVPSFGFIEKASYVLAAAVTFTALAGNVATYTAANTFTSGSKVTVIGCTNGGATFNVTNATIASATATNFTIAITHADVGSQPETGTATSGSVFEVSNIMNVLGAGNESGTPAFIAPQTDDNAGNITFRILPLPDQTYQATVIFQKRMPGLITSPSNTWAPIPDHYSYVYQSGFAALMFSYWNDPRWGMYNQKFVAGLLGAAEGLTEDQKNVFSRTWYNSITEQQFTGLRTQQGVQGLGSQ
jgi:hypothetical protein